MKNLFDLFVDSLKSRREKCIDKKDIFQLPYVLLRENNSKDELRSLGVFFTSQCLAERLIKRTGVFEATRKVYDPAAGAGDLLLAYADMLPIYDSVEETIESWSSKIYATDIEDSFIKILKLRLILLATLKLQGEVSLKDIDLGKVDDVFNNIYVGNFQDFYFDVDLILVNPPYSAILPEVKYQWASGKVSNAAVFLFELQRRYPSVTIAAIVPDVMRSGSRYAKLRKELSGFAMDKEVPVGRFDKFTDVDVFFAVSHLGCQNVKMESLPIMGRALGDYYTIKVGSVVPHRDVQEGVECYYLTARNVSTNKEIRRFKEKIRSLHNPVKGPFIVVKRTSSPSDKVRCAASLIASKSLFHIENHLLLLLPNHNVSLKQSREHLKYLNGLEVTHYLNQAIRCRHLTVEVVKKIPIKE